ncbi:NAD(P)-binding protein [Thozetella sp. PMI_491]|nr:NAD(P)-binding protein [Thozetella sp. PMI_491]
MAAPTTSLPKGSWVLVTGANSYVSSHILKQFLERGYRVRATARNVAEASWIADEVFKSYTDAGSFELVSVPDISADHAFDAAAKGVSAIIHVASIGGFDPDPNNVIPQTVASVTTILETALKEPSVKEFVFMSSCTAAANADADTVVHVERDTWNEAALQAAWAPPPYGPAQGFIVYMASKVAAEKALWKFVDEQKPQFSVNSVCPYGVMGEPLHKNYVRSTGAFIPLIYNGQVGHADGQPGTYVTDVKDVALLTVAAALDPEVKNARIQAWGHSRTWNEILDILKKLRPQHQFVEDLHSTRRVGQTTDPAEALGLLKKWGGQDGYRPLEETLEENLIFYAINSKI